MKKIQKILLFPSLLLTIPFFVKAGWGEGLVAVGNFGLPVAYVDEIIENTLLWILGMFTFLCVIAFIIYGIMFLMAGGSQVAQEKAKKGVMYAIIGIAVGISGYIIINFIDELLMAVL